MPIPFSKADWKPAVLDWQSNKPSEWGSLYHAHPDPFAILGLSVDANINEVSLNKAYRQAVTHAFETIAAPPKTRGPTIPTWVQINGARDQMATPNKLIGLRSRWVGKSRPTWNPWAPKGSREAHFAPTAVATADPSLLSSLQTPTRPPPPSPSSLQTPTKPPPLGPLSWAAKKTPAPKKSAAPTTPITPSTPTKKRTPTSPAKRPPPTTPAKPREKLKTTPTSQAKRPPPTIPTKSRKMPRTISSPFSDSPFIGTAGTPRKRRVTTPILISSSSESGSEAEHPSPSLAQKSSSQQMVPLPAYVVDGNEYDGRVTEPPPPCRREAYASRTTPPPVIRVWRQEVSAHRRAGAALSIPIGTGTATSSFVPTGPRTLSTPSHHSTSLLSTGPRPLSTASGLSTSAACLPGTPGRNSRKPKIFGVLIGTWSGSTKPEDQSNAVFGSRDIQGRINRRASCKTLSGQNATNTGLSPHVISLSHNDVNYLPDYQRLFQQEIDDRIMPMLMEAESKVFGNAAKRQRED